MTETTEPPRAVGHFLLLVLAAFVLAGSALASRRPVVGASAPNLVDVAAIPARADPDNLRRFTQAYGALIAKTDWRGDLGRRLGRERVQPDAPVRLGYWVREWTLLGVPLFAHREGGYSLYLDYPYTYQAVALGEEALAQLGRDAGGRFWEGWWFPWWRFGWGWIVPVLVAGFFWREHRWQQRRRDALGLI